MSRLHATDVTLAYDGRVVVEGLSFEVPDGRITVIIGPNACGKSTLLRALSRLLRPRDGTVVLDGQSIHRLPTKQVAKLLGLLPQSPIAPDGILVGDLVARGRTPHQSLFQQWSVADETAVREALEATGTADLVDRPVDELSGGQRQRGSRWRSRSRPGCCCSTNPPRSSTSPTRSRCSTWSPTSTVATAARSCWCCTT
ncbi:MAG: ABC transporter ATP-binding protein [Ilumatobacteraceae bacterium]